MNISLFNRKYCMRRFGEQRNVKGYLTSDYKDETISIHLHSASEESETTSSEGNRNMSRLQGHGNIKLIAADQELNQKGDLVYYDGHWFECRGCTRFDHTVLGHYNYSFVEVPVDVGNSVDLAPPSISIK